MNKVVVTGAGGFIGHHLVSSLKGHGYWVRGVDVNYPHFKTTIADEFLLLDLRQWENCLAATKGMEEVYALAADMGGMGFISSHHAQILHNNSLNQYSYSRCCPGKWSPAVSVYVFGLHLS